jgi:hypothetical protein
MATNVTLSIFLAVVTMLVIACTVPVTATSSALSSSTPVIKFAQPVDLLSPITAKSDNAGGNSGNSNAGGNSGNSNAGGNSGSSNAGGNSGSSNAGGNSGNSNAGGNSGSSNAGGNSGSSNAGGNSGSSNAGGNSGSSNAGADAEKTLGITGSQVNNKENTREITLDLQKAKDAGESISVRGTVITISKGPLTISITTAEPREIDGVKTAVVRSVSMEHQPITARIKDTGPVSASFRADLTSLPPSDSTITVNITDHPGQPAQEAFDQAASNQGYRVDSIAYAMDIAKNNLSDGKDIGPATVTMSMNSSWVADHGSAASVRIVRFADDGTSQLLKTRYTGIDSSENQVFEGTSPGGLSIFALISVRAVPEATITPQIRPEPTVTGSVPLNGIMTPLLIGLPLGVLGIFFMIYRRAV